MCKFLSSFILFLFISLNAVHAQTKYYLGIWDMKTRTLFKEKTLNAEPSDSSILTFVKGVSNNFYLVLTTSKKSDISKAKKSIASWKYNQLRLSKNEYSLSLSSLEQSLTDGTWRMLKNSQLNQLYVAERFCLKNGQKNDLGFIYFGKGQIRYIATYENGNAVTMTQFDSQGKLIYLKTGRSGTIETWNGQGARITLVNLDTSLQYHGVKKMWHENGNIKLVGQYEHGEEVGKWSYYDLNGNLESSKEYE